MNLDPNVAAEKSPTGLAGVYLSFVTRMTVGIICAGTAAVLTILWGCRVAHSRSISDSWLQVLGGLVIIGALNWGFIGLFNYDLIAAVFGQSEMALRIVDSIIGIAAVLFIVMMFMNSEKYKK